MCEPSEVDEEETVELDLTQTLADEEETVAQLIHIEYVEACIYIK